MREIGEIIKIKNPLGIMKVKVVKKLDVTKIGNHFGSIGDFQCIRIEMYNDNVFTIYDGVKGNNTIYLFKTFRFDKDDAEGYECEIIETEQPTYDYERIDCEG